MNQKVVNQNWIEYRRTMDLREETKIHVLESSLLNLQEKFHQNTLLH
jgi:hypothetical protein